MVYTIYDNTGKILWVTYPSDEYKDPSTIAPEFNYLEGEGSGDTQYIDNGVITDRPSMNLSVDKTTIVANGTDEATISNIPSGATATCEGESLTIDDGELVFTADTAGIYTIKFECWPYLDEEVTINAT